MNKPGSHQLHAPTFSQRLLDQANLIFAKGITAGTSAMSIYEMVPNVKDSLKTFAIKKQHVIYVHDSNEPVERYVIDNVHDARLLSYAYGESYGNVLFKSWKKFVEEGKKIVVNDSGGWCPLNSSVRLANGQVLGEKIGIL